MSEIMNQTQENIRHDQSSDNSPNLSVNIAGVKLRNPVIAASGTFGSGSEYADIMDVSLLGGICTKGLTLSGRPGNTGVRIWETHSGLLNSIGLENSGIPAFIEKQLPYLRHLGPAVIANLSGAESNEYVKGAVLLNESSIDMIELNISCPNVKVGGMAFGLDPGTAAALVSAVRRVCRHKPLMVKLSPNAPSISAVAQACINAGADALSLINTFKAMAIDVVNRKPVFDNISAGLSGPAVKPIALNIVWELFEKVKESKTGIPIVGIGGISGPEDALEFLMAGSSAVQVGSATFSNPHTMIEIIDGIKKYMTANKMQNIGDISIRNKW
ncbi:MAG: dihydroorotate dehydrogenase [Treponema sp.]|jgi:dihydroorotate dehydrogenase (NAD+) catalytic subunit|nr:dihydroorotate dehydrogenase [Treponema sp.]